MRVSQGKFAKLCSLVFSLLLSKNLTLKIPELETGKQLPLVEEFYTIQGEGFHTGKPAYFIRIGGCDVGCSWCDTKFSWDPDLHPLVDTDIIVRNVNQSKCNSVVVTGGEPSLYNLDYLCEQLKKYEIKTFVETSGAYPLTGIWDWICLSPKENTPPLNDIFKKADELKVIIQKPKDFKWAEINAANVNIDCKLFLQPEWSMYSKILPEIVEYVKENTKWSISLQSHKFMHIP